MNSHCRILGSGAGLRLAAIGVVLLAGTSIAAAATDEGIVVRGDGSAKARPTQVEMAATLSAEAPLAADALVKFHDAKKRAIAAIEALKNPDLTVESGGVSVNSGAMDANTQMMIMRGMSAPNTTKSVRLTETSQIVLDHADKLKPDELLEKLLKIIDVAKDAGFQIGPAPATNYWEMQMRAQEGDTSSATVAFKLPDSTPLRDAAYKSALHDARDKAQRLADLAGVKLGRIISVHDAESPKSENGAMIMYFYGSLNNKDSSAGKSIAGPTSGDLVLHTSLEVQFELAK